MLQQFRFPFIWLEAGEGRFDVPRTVKKKNACADWRDGIWMICDPYNRWLGETDVGGVPELIGQTCLGTGFAQPP